MCSCRCTDVQMIMLFTELNKQKGCELIVLWSGVVISWGKDMWEISETSCTYTVSNIALVCAETSEKCSWTNPVRLGGCGCCNQGVRVLITLTKSTEYILGVVFSFHLGVTPPDAVPLGTSQIWTFCANGFIMGLLSSPAFVCAIIEIFPRVPAHLLYPVSTPEDADVYCVVVLLTVF